MKVAIPTFNSRVSPRFDFAAKVLIATIENGKVVDREHFALTNLNTIRRCSLLREQGVAVVICGGISNFSVRLLSENGIEVIPLVAGELEDVLEQFAVGHLVAPPTSFAQKKKGGGYGLRKGRCRGGRRNIT
jgi:predicted Fe-Mo cluster-binding NifX family protein